MSCKSARAIRTPLPTDPMHAPVASPRGLQDFLRRPYSGFHPDLRAMIRCCSFGFNQLFTLSRNRLDAQLYLWASRSGSSTRRRACSCSIRRGACLVLTSRCCHYAQGSVCANPQQARATSISAKHLDSKTLPVNRIARDRYALQ